MGRRFQAMILVIAMVLAILSVPVTAASEVASGTCGTNLTWSLDADGTLTVSGTGVMQDFGSPSNASWYDKHNAIKTITITDGVTSIGRNAFLGCANLTSVTISGSVTSIEDYAFYHCTSLPSVDIPDGVTSIGWGAFEGCASLTSVTIPDSVTSMEYGVFAECTSLPSVIIPSSVTSIEGGMFMDCTSLTSVTIPDSVTSIKETAFCRCTNLISVTIPDSVTSIGVYAFLECTSLSSAGPIGSGCDYQFGWTESIPANAFSGCSGLTSVTIPASVTSIGSDAFSKCTSLTSAGPIGSGCDYQFGWTESIPANAFSGGSGLTSVTIPASVTSIGDNVFNGCTSLTDVYYWGTEERWNANSMGNTSGLPTVATVWYPGPASLSPRTMTSSIAGGSMNPVLIIESDRPFKPIIARTTMNNVTVDEGSTGLTLSNVSLIPSDATNKTMQLEFNGFSEGGDVTITIDSSAFAGPENFTDTPPLVFNMPRTGVGGMIIKHVINGGPDAAASKQYTFTVTGPEDYNYSKSVTITGADQTTISVPSGEYTVTLDRASAAIDGYTLNVENNPATVKVSSVPSAGGSIPSATITSTYTATEPILGRLTIRHTIDGGPGSAASKQYTFTVTGSGDYNRSVTITGAGETTIEVPVGECTVSLDRSSAEISGYTLEARNSPATVTVNYETTPVVAITSAYTVRSSGSGGPSNPTPTPRPKPKPTEPSDPDNAPIQQEILRKDREEIPDWIDRLEVPDYVQTLYNVMAGETTKQADSAGRKQSVFEVEENFRVTASQTGGTAQVEQVEIVDFDLMEMYGPGQTKLTGNMFEDEDFFRVSAEAGDKAVDYSSLRTGNVVKTSAYNGVFVVKAPYDTNFDQTKKEICSYAAAVYHAFDRDEPGIFWLSGKCKIRIAIITDSGTGAKEAYFFLVLADKDGFTMCAPAWTEAGSIAAGMTRRDKAAETILQSVTASDTAGKIKQLNKWITEHNQYNTTPDLTTISNEPHECLSALEGRIGTDGPVCDGYSRAFKLLCDRLSIPCVLETGWAKAQANGTAEFHMWSLVQVNGVWYGADITWNDPTVKDFEGAVSGRENENFLLVGANTPYNGFPFSQSHVVENRAAEGGVDFNNGPVLNLVAFSGVSALAFEDVPSDAYFYEGVLWAVDRGITSGTSATTFSPNAPCTEVQLLTFLWRAMGKPSSSTEIPAALSGIKYAEGALRWATEKGMIDGSFQPDTPCTRANAVKYIWQAEGAPNASGAVFTDVPAGSDYAQAVAWAVSKGITAGVTPAVFSPDKVCSRAQIVTFLRRDRA